MTTTDGGIMGTVITGGVKRNKRYADGRVCAEPMCETTLSIYNRHRTCWAHTAEEKYTRRGVYVRSKAS